MWTLHFDFWYLNLSPRHVRRACFPLLCCWGRQEVSHYLCHCNQGHLNLKISQGDSGGDVDKIFELILYDFKDFDLFPEKVGGMHPPHPPPCDVLGFMTSFIRKINTSENISIRM